MAGVKSFQLELEMEPCGDGRKSHQSCQGVWKAEPLESSSSAGRGLVRLTAQLGKKINSGLHIVILFIIGTASEERQPRSLTLEEGGCDG